MNTSWTDLANAIGSLATASGVFIAVWQIQLQRRQQTTEFEDELDREYRDIALALPMEALFGEVLTTEVARTSLEQFHRYVDLTNEQVFLRQEGRVTVARWAAWSDEIKLNFSKPAFKSAWEEIKLRAPGEFVLLRRLESVGFDSDPKEW